MDPAKLKVVELRAELANLGLDTKGNKPVLVDRLRAALSRQGQDVAETTIADTSTEEIGEEAGNESPPRTRRPGPASRTRRRQSSSEPPPPTPTRSSRRDPEASKIIPAIEETMENQDVFTVDDSSDSNQDCVLSEVAKSKETTPIQAPISPVKQPETPKIVAVTETPAPIKEQPPSVIKQTTPIKEQPAPVQQTSPVIQSLPSPVKQTSPVIQKREPSPVKQPSPTIQRQESSPVKPQVSPVERSFTPGQISPRVIQATAPHVSPVKSAHVAPEKEETPEKSTSPIKTVTSPTTETTPLKMVDAPQTVASPIREPTTQTILQSPTKESPVKPVVPEKSDVPEKLVVSEEKPVSETEEESQKPCSIDPTETASRDDAKIHDRPDEMEVDTPSGDEPVPTVDEARETQMNDQKDDNKKSEDKDSDPKTENKRKREKHSRWGNFYQNDETTAATAITTVTTTPDNDVQVTGEYISIRDDDDEKGRSRSKRSRKRPRAPSPRRKSPVKIPEPEIPKDKVTLSWYDSDLNLHITVPEMNVAIPLTEGGFGHCWAGARSSHGVREGKICYEVRIESMLSLPEDCVPGIRFGWSTSESSLHLGDSKLSWGFEHSGRKVNDGNFEEYGTTLKEKDVVGVYVDFESSPCNIFYSINGESQGTAFEFDKEILEDAALFPHILSRNCCYRVNYGHEEYNLMTKTKVIKRQVDTVNDEKIPDQPEEEKEEIKIDNQGSEQYDPSKCSDDEQEKPTETSEKEKSDKMDVDEQEKASEEKKDGAEQSESKQTTLISIEVDGEEAKMLEGYILIGKLPFEQLVAGPQRPVDEDQCEVIMMCGLPGSGKTYWSTKYVSEHPEKRFNILGTNSFAEKMKIDCKPFKTQFEGKWKMLISKVTKCVVKLIEIAQNRRRNYILDQTNVYPSAQRRKMREFNNGYKRTAVVIVPDETTYEERQRLREEKDGKDAPDGAVLEMKANFVLPEKCSWLDEVIFAELDEEASKKLLEKYNKEGRAAGYNNNGSNGGSRRSHSAGGSRSSSGAPSISKRSRFDNGPNDRGRYGGHDRGRHNAGPMRNRDTRRDRRGGGGNWGGRQGGWGGREWGGPRDQSYGRDHHPYGRDAYGRDQPYGRDRNRDAPPGPHPYRGSSDRWVNRGGHRGRDSRGGMDSRGRGGIMDRGRGEGNDRGGNKSSWGQHRGGSATGGSVAGRNQSNQFNRGGQQRIQNSTGQSRGGGHSSGEGQGTWGHQPSNSSSGWGQQTGGNWQGGWSQQTGWNSNWGNWSSAGGGGQWNKFHGQQQTTAAGQQGQQQQQQQQQQQTQQPQAQQQQQQQQSQQGQWGQWGSWPAQQQQSYWASQWNVQPGRAASGGEQASGGNASASAAAGSTQTATAQQQQLWAQFSQTYAQSQGYGTALAAANASSGTVATQEKK